MSEIEKVKRGYERKTQNYRRREKRPLYDILVEKRTITCTLKKKKLPSAYKKREEQKARKKSP